MSIFPSPLSFNIFSNRYRYYSILLEDTIKSIFPNPEVENTCALDTEPL